MLALKVPCTLCAVALFVPLAVALYVLPNPCTHSANLRNLPTTLGCAVKTKMSDLLCIMLIENISRQILLD